MRQTRRAPPSRRATTPRAVNNILAIFDSGLGGLTVLRALRALLPSIDLLYLADQAHVPYGDRTPPGLHALMETNIRHLETCGATAIVMGCNTSCAVAATEGWPKTPLPILDLIEVTARHLAATNAQRIAILATKATASSGAYGQAIRRHHPTVSVVEHGTSELVPLVESGRLTGPATEAAVARALAQFPANIETLVLACTHFPILAPHFAHLTKARSTLDPAIPQAAAAATLASTLGRATGSATTHYITTAAAAPFEAALRSLNALTPRDFVTSLQSKGEASRGAEPSRSAVPDRRISRGSA